MAILINGRVDNTRNLLETWGDLLSSVDADLEAAGDIVTAVRLDGVDEPAFRDPALCLRPVSSFAAIEVETGSPALLARACLGDAALALADLSQAARDAATGFRCADIADARGTLEQLSIGLLAVLQIVSAASLALRREMEAATADGRSISSLSADLDRIIQELIAGQNEGDWLQVADILEYDLNPTLDSWQTALSEAAAA
jgi:hypothetical protein